MDLWFGSVRFGVGFCCESINRDYDFGKKRVVLVGSYCMLSSSD